MRTSLLTFLGDSQGGSSPVDAYVRDLRAARDQGFDFAWAVQLPWEHDALITLPVALREVDGTRVGTGVQPIQTRHPMALAQEALTLSALSDGRFTLGIGLSHAVVSQGMWGSPGIARCDGSTLPRLPAAAVDHRRSGRGGPDHHRARTDPDTRRPTTAGLPRGARTALAETRPAVTSSARIAPTCSPTARASTPLSHGCERSPGRWAM